MTAIYNKEAKKKATNISINSELGVFNSNLQLLLILKALLALVIASGVVYSLANKILKKTPHPIMKHFHSRKYE
jgi:hypothetical protein